MNLPLVYATLMLSTTLVCGCKSSPSQGDARSEASTVCEPVRDCSGHAPRLRITVDASGFQPAAASAVGPLTLVFRRTTNATCADEVVIPALGIRRSLPVDQDVEVFVTAPLSRIDYSCPTGMFHGVVVAER